MVLIRTSAVTVEGYLLTLSLVLLVLLNGSFNARLVVPLHPLAPHTPPPHSPSPITPITYHPCLSCIPPSPPTPPSPSFPPLTSTQQQSRSLKSCTRRPLTLRRRLGGPPPLPREDAARCGSQTHRQHTVRQSEKGVDNEGDRLSSVLPPSPSTW